MDEPCSALDPVADAEDRGADRRAQGALHDRDRHPQHAAGGARRRHDGVHARRRAGRARRRPTKIFTNPDDERTEELRHREVRLGGGMQETRHAVPRGAQGARGARRSAASTSSSSSSTARSRRSSTRTSSSPAMVVADDDRIDGRYLEVHQGILSLLARQAPVAGDLRIVAALLHVIRCIERMGDQCVNIAKLVPLSGHEPPKDKDILDAIERMGQLRALAGRRRPSEAFAARNVDAGRGPRAPGRRDQPAQPRDLPARGRGRRRRRHARVGDVHDPGRARAWSGSATTPSTSPSRWCSSSPGCSASSPTPRRRPRRRPPASRQAIRPGGERPRSELGRAAKDWSRAPRRTLRACADGHPRSSRSAAAASRWSGATRCSTTTCCR